jgi:BlaI family transcriptional regulator, penicillinase repressor
MVRPVSPTLTEAELRLMKILWDRGPSTVNEVVEALADEVSLAESTVRTMLGILKDKGYLSTTARGRASVYHPRVDRAEVRRSVARYMIDRFFDGSPQELVLNILNDEELDESEIARLRQMIQEDE